LWEVLGMALKCLKSELEIFAVQRNSTQPDPLKHFSIGHFK
jgi:hypothetical protein